MNLNTTILFYLLFGVATAIAQFCTVRERTHLMRVFEAATAVIFWPLFLPYLFRRERRETEGEMDVGVDLVGSKHDELSAAIQLVEEELASSLRPVSGVPLTVLESERRRFHQLREIWRFQVKRIRELDTVLGTPTFELPTVPIFDAFHNEPPPVSHSEVVRRDNLHRLKLVRERARTDLMSTLERVRELVTLIHLAKFTGAPTTRSEDLLTEIELAVRELPKSFETC